jgi:hypothetical protein
VKYHGETPLNNEYALKMKDMIAKQALAGVGG